MREDLQLIIVSIHTVCMYFAGGGEVLRSHGSALAPYFASLTNENMYVRDIYYVLISCDLGIKVTTIGVRLFCSFVINSAH